MVLEEESIRLKNICLITAVFSDSEVDSIDMVIFERLKYYILMMKVVLVSVLVPASLV